MTDQQRKNMQAVADAIRQGYTQTKVDESYAVGQIALVTRRTWDQALEGLRIMRSEGMIPPSWIKPETDGVLVRLAGKSPAIAELFSRFDLIPGKTEIIAFCGFCRPKMISPDHVRKALSLPEF